MEIGQVVIEEPAVHGAGDTGVVHHDVQTAEFLDGGSHQRPNLFRIGDVRAMEDSAAAQRGGQGLSPGGLDVGDDDPRALGQEPFHRGTSDARGPPGDDGYFTGEFVNHTTS